MLNFFRKIFGLLSIEEALYQTKRIKIEGVLFTIRKINSLDYLNGSKVMLQIFDTYKNTPQNQINESHIKKVKEHYRDVLMAGIVKPVLSRNKDDGTKIFVDEVLDNWEMATKVYEQIIAFTYGKKKLLASQDKNLSNSISLVKDMASSPLK